MSTIQIKKCDICGREVRNDTNKEEFETGFEEIYLGFGHPGFSPHYQRYGTGRYNIARPEIVACEQCMAKLGIVRHTEAESREKPDMPTDVLYELVVNIVNQCLEQRS